MPNMKKVFSLRKFVLNMATDFSMSALIDALKSGWPQDFDGKTFEECKTASISTFQQEAWTQWVEDK